MSTHAPKAAASELPADVKIAVVAARFNEHIVGELLSGCLKRLAELGASDTSVVVHRVPGAFELPVTAKLLAQTKRYEAVICLGAVIRGETPHFDYVAGECARGLQHVAIETAIPIIFGVLTTNTEEQAKDRIGGKHGHAGISSAQTAAEMILLARQIKQGSSR